MFKLFGQSRNCPENPETVRTIQKLSGQSKNCSDNLKTVQTIQKVFGQSRNCPDNPETEHSCLYNLKLHIFFCNFFELFSLNTYLSQILTLGGCKIARILVNRCLSWCWTSNRMHGLQYSLPFGIHPDTLPGTLTESKACLMFYHIPTITDSLHASLPDASPKACLIFSFEFCRAFCLLLRGSLYVETFKNITCLFSLCSQEGWETWLVNMHFDGTGGIFHQKLRNPHFFKTIFRPYYLKSVGWLVGP